MIDAIEVRIAGREDANTLAILGKRTFKDAFGAQNNPHDLAAYLSEAFSQHKIEEELKEPGSKFCIAYNDLQAIGYIKLRTTKIPDCIEDPSPIELERIYVDQRYIGKGIGARLMQKAIDEGTAAGYKTIWLGVWKKNTKAVSFYEKWGFEIVGEHEFLIGEDLQHDHIMSRELKK